MKKDNLNKLEYAEMFYKFSLATGNTIETGDINLMYHGKYSFLKHTFDNKDLALTESEEKEGARILRFIGTYMIALQLNKILEDEWGKNRIHSKDSQIQNISQVIRLIRNAFAHDPLNPIWDISNSAKNKVYDIPDILTLKTHNLHGKRVNRYDYGGPLALLKLIQHIKTIL